MSGRPSGYSQNGKSRDSRALTPAQEDLRNMSMARDGNRAVTRSGPSSSPLRNPFEIFEKDPFFQPFAKDMQMFHRDAFGDNFFSGGGDVFRGIMKEHQDIMSHMHKRMSLMENDMNKIFQEFRGPSFDRSVNVHGDGKKAFKRMEMARHVSVNGVGESQYRMKNSEGHEKHVRRRQLGNRWRQITHERGPDGKEMKNDTVHGMGPEDAKSFNEEWSSAMQKRTGNRSKNRNSARLNWRNEGARRV